MAPTADTLLTAQAVRVAARQALALANFDGLLHWRVDLDAMVRAVDLTVATIRDRYPDLSVPFHARWRHFTVDDLDLWARANVHQDDKAKRARAAFDLAIVSVLLDAGAGMDWRYRDETGAVLARSEGLAIASFRMMQAGAFSADPADPWRADAARLAALTGADIAAGFQVSAGNPLVGVDGRADLLARLGRHVLDHDDIFRGRPGGLFDHLAGTGTVAAPDILRALLLHLGPIWPSRERLDGVPLGDCWCHPLLGLVPFHKLSQWLSYSLIEPLRAAAVAVTDIDGLTGLPEYRNGGLFLDTGVIVAKDLDDLARAHEVSSALVVEWRALTVALLDLIAPTVRERLAVTADAFPLACVLEGGTWAAGRRIAASLRADGGPPLKITSDGTVF
jgi:Protein of unknown function (DUF1688)